jgi:multimeric flavodoxin WrbA
MAKILIVYHSQSGHTERMAQAVARGAKEMENAVVLLKSAKEATEEDLIECDGLIIGSPEYFGYMAGAVKDFFDRTYEKVRGRKGIYRKPLALFISAGNDGRGALDHIGRICKGFQFRKAHNPIISRGEVTEEILEECAEMGRVMAAGCEARIF